LPSIKKEAVRTISYQKPLRDIEAVAKALDVKTSSAKEVGIRTFDYVYEREVTD